MQIKLIFSRTDCALSLILKARVYGTRKWPTVEKKKKKKERELYMDRLAKGRVQTYSKALGAFHSTKNSGNFGCYIKWNGPFRFGPTGIFGTSFEGGPL